MKVRYMIAILATFLLVSCSQKEVVEQYDYQKEIQEMQFECSLTDYILAFEEYLNNGTNSLNLIDSSLINEVSTIIDNVDGIEPTLPFIEGNEEEDEAVEYPIVDIDGTIIGYGTKEESDKSFEIYNEQPYYRVESADISFDTILFKVYNKGEQKTLVYEAELDSENRITNMIKLKIGGSK